MPVPVEVNVEYEYVQYIQQMEALTEFFIIFIICLIVFVLNIYFLRKFDDKIFLVIFMLIGISIYLHLFTFPEF